jgi:hypothetical protein
MTPEIAIDRVQCFLRWNASRIDALDEDHAPIANPACYRRGKDDKLEYWITAAIWRDVLFSDDEDGDAPRIIANLGLLRMPMEPGNFQVCADIRRKITKVYAVRAGILTVRSSIANGANGHAGNGARCIEKTPVSASPVVIPPDGQPPSLGHRSRAG